MRGWGRLGVALAGATFVGSLVAAPVMAADVAPPSVYINSITPTAVQAGGLATVSASAFDDTDVASAEVKVGTGGWAPMLPVDGAFDSAYEELTADVTAPGAPGTYDVCVRASDSALNVSDGTACLPLTVVPPPPDPLPIAQAIATSSVTVTGASWVAVPAAATTAGVGSAALTGFPLQGGSFGILTTGDVAAIPVPDSFASKDAGGDSVRGDTDYDVTILKVDLSVPNGANCLAFGFRFLSEEYPTYVSTQFNDAFIAELDTSTWTTSGSTITAPNNFAFDGSGDVVSINSTGLGEMTAAAGAGTAFDGQTTGGEDSGGGATGVLGAATAVTPGSHSVYFSIFDQGDHIYDAVVFLDNLRSLTVGNPVTDCTAGAVLAPKVTTHPQSQTVPAGSTATFTAASVPAASVQWQVLPPAGSWTDIPGATSTTLSFTALLADTGKQYHAVFSNLAGTATTNAATLTVQSSNTLTVSRSGSGSGTVTSSPAGIDCGATCSALFVSSTSVTLTATPAVGSAFTGWSGSGCTGTGTCVVSMSAARVVSAAFTDAPPTATLTAPSSPTKAATLTYTLAFSEPVTGLAAGDFVRTGTATGCTVDAPTGSGSSYSVTVSGCSAGTVGLSLAAGSVVDGSAIAGPPSPAAAATVTIDRTAPTVSAIVLVPATAPVSGSVHVTATGTDPSGVASAAVSVDGGPFDAMSAADGHFGGTSEGLAADVGAPATPGTYQVCVQATDVPGTTSDGTACATLTVLPTYFITVSRTGTGSGTVTSSPAGLSCGVDCNVGFMSGKTITLTATPSAGSLFDGWTGAGCSGTGTCVITLSADVGVTASFTASSDTTPPTATAPGVTPRVGIALSGTSPSVTVAWSGSDAGGTGIARYELARSTDGGTTWAAPQVLTGTSTTALLPTSGTVRYRVRAIDGASNVGGWATGPTLTPRLVQQTTSAITYSGTWSSRSSSSYSGGSVKYSSKAGASATYKATGRAIALVATKGKTRGKVKVYVNGSLAATVDLYSSSTKYRVVAWQKTYATSATRTIKLVVVGTAGRPRVDLDAFVVIK